MKITYYAAVSLDGFIADQGGQVGFLDGLDPAAYGFDDFLSTIDSLVMGRKTFDQALQFGWAFGERPAAILTSRELPPTAPNSAFKISDVGEIRNAFREQNVWCVGGGNCAAQLLAEGLLNELDLFRVATVLGDGVGLFQPAPVVQLELVESAAMEKGVVRTRYIVTRK